MNKNARMAHLVGAASQARRFSHFGGNNAPFGNEGFVGVKSNASGQIMPPGLPSRSYAQGNPMPGNINVVKSTKTIRAKIWNTDTADLACPLFSVNEGLPIPFDGITDIFTGNTAGAGTGIRLQWVGYDSVAEISDIIRTTPFVVTSVRYFHNTATQLKTEWYNRRKQFDSVCSEPIYPLEYVNIFQQNAVIADLDEFTTKVDATYTLAPVVLGGTSEADAIQLVFKIGTIIDQTNPLVGQGLVSQFNQDAGKIVGSFA